MYPQGMPICHDATKITVTGCQDRRLSFVGLIWPETMSAQQRQPIEETHLENRPLQVQSVAAATFSYQASLLAARLQIHGQALTTENLKTVPCDACVRGLHAKLAHLHAQGRLHSRAPLQRSQLVMQQDHLKEAQHTNSLHTHEEYSGRLHRGGAPVLLAE